MAVTADGEANIDDLREESTCEVDVLLGDLKSLGYNIVHMQYFLQETRALEIADQIPKLQKQIASLQKMKERIHQNSTSALGLASAPSDDRSTKELKRTHPENLSVAADEHKQSRSAATSRSRDSQPRGRSLKQLRPAVGCLSRAARAFWSGRAIWSLSSWSLSLLRTHTNSTYEKTTRAAEFLNQH